MSMGIFSGLFKSRDKPQNRTAGSGYAFFMGGTTSRYECKSNNHRKPANSHVPL